MCSHLSVQSQSAGRNISVKHVTPTLVSIERNVLMSQMSVVIGAALTVFDWTVETRVLLEGTFLSVQELLRAGWEEVALRRFNASAFIDLSHALGCVHIALLIKLVYESEPQ